MIAITDDTAIAEDELTFVASRSPGPGGQNVNKVATRVTLRFDVMASASLTSEQKERIREALPTRISKAGILAVSSQRHRTQGANRAAAVERLVALLGEALVTAPERKPTRVPARVARRRLEQKRLRGRRKRERSQPREGEWS